MKNKKMTFEQADEIYQDLYQKAVNRYCEKTDWDINEWLDKKENKKFQKASFIIFSKI